MKYGFFALVLTVAAAQPVFADTTHGASDAYEAYRTTVTQLQSGDIQTPVTLAVGLMVHQGLEILRDSGYPDVADKEEAEWNAHYGNRVLTAADWVPGLQHKGDLGDHAPANQWLADFYDKLVKLTHGAVKGIRVIADINTVNYALPVVFAPKGTWQTGAFDADKIEYRKHFIPFANIITYWSSDKLCEYACTRYVPELPMLKQVCDPAAQQLEHYMGRYVAWQISDYIFGAAMGQSQKAPNVDILDFQTFQLLLGGAQ